jgi:hypothetical protein
MKISLPSELKEEKVFPFAATLRGYLMESELLLDYGPIQYAFPFGALVLSEEIKRFAEDRHKLGLRTQYTGYSEKNYCHSYLAHIGFFEHHGISKGRKPGEASGSTAYVPFRNISLSDLQQVSKERGISQGAAIEEEAGRLAQVVLQLGEPIKDHPVAYCFREVIRNTFEHGEIATCSVCAQKWYKGDLEIAVADRGRGILRSLSERYTFSSNSAALREAIKPGVTRAGDKPDVEDDWHNSGFGLYVLSELASQTGHFLICSGDSGLFCQGSDKYDRNYSFSGTAVKLSMQKPRGVNINKMIRAIVKAGEELVPRGGTRTASKSTKRI